MKGYKAFNAGWKCRDFQYEIGKTYELPKGQELKMCECGFHFCKNPIDVFGYYDMTDDVLIAEVEALGEIKQEGTKYCTDKIRIVKEFTRKQLKALILDGKYNTGKNNTGNYNSGDRNSGYYNSGSYNSGSYNSGHRNSGDRNSGHRNSGSYNSGHRNSGYRNSGDYNSGIFNTDEPKMRAFNCECDVTTSEFLKSLDYDFYDLCDRISNKNLADGDVDKIKALPNFDAKIFAEITGIEVE